MPNLMRRLVPRSYHTNTNTDADKTDKNDDGNGNTNSANHLAFTRPHTCFKLRGYGLTQSLAGNAVAPPHPQARHNKHDLMEDTHTHTTNHYIKHKFITP